MNKLNAYNILNAYFIVNNDYLILYNQSKYLNVLILNIK